MTFKCEHIHLTSPQINKYKTPQKLSLHPVSITASFFPEVTIILTSPTSLVDFNEPLIYCSHRSDCADDQNRNPILIVELQKSLYEVV